MQTAPVLFHGVDPSAKFYLSSLDKRGKELSWQLPPTERGVLFLLLQALYFQNRRVLAVLSWYQRGVLIFCRKFRMAREKSITEIE
ncbi:MAG: hypothetical protein A3D96_06480 [Chlamydiae bacterium RIFCSPHIGHO2_12_FULL_44_59]|nr:MAG: hypothetical protein A2796_06605 [Chlamydiae bacterium RIFCSPHIGHO2_01_FULL_44_39]OGN59665.1 MAG: hypothetical protein A3D96_06480 [Chlamydiae bacterium RIFCSPHIGHO2_12_FULL_44_59]OGN65755.1 MAG: hypothetical protein A2978_07475 [Chlamydiae bacterium RIFCSPLOWO2_01_FULL_44_52]OGN67898.1 MAG: hypothetical protein A3I67_05955 [Chlamydiae bacterium RIFCSPLOWO2_02_FULL_45_22]OGN69388.1 MAG: hypothetical protein A3F79_06690 [Chlamydiae bacterium RIFCSPLOWO2_12_FULL_45_20]